MKTLRFLFTFLVAVFCGVANIVLAGPEQLTSPVIKGAPDFSGVSNASALRGWFGLAIGTNVQAYSANLTTLAAIAPSANVQTLLGAADYAAFRTSLGLVIGTNVQAYNANLTTFSGIAPSANVQAILAAANYAAVRTLLGLVDFDSHAPGPLGDNTASTGDFTTLTASTLASSTTLATETRVLTHAIFAQKWATSNEFVLFPGSGSFSGTTSGTGAQATVLFGNCRPVSGTTANGYGAFYTTNGVAALLCGPSGVMNHINWSKAGWLTVQFSAGLNSPGGGNFTSLTTNGWARFSIGETATHGALAHKGIGIKVTKNSGTLADVALETYDSSLHTSASLATVDFQALDTSGGATSPLIHTATFYWDGGGNVSLFLDNATTAVGTAATAPTGSSSNSANIIFECNNGGDTTSNEAWFYSIKGGIAN